MPLNLLNFSPWVNLTDQALSSSVPLDSFSVDSYWYKTLNFQEEKPFFFSVTCQEIENCSLRFGILLDIQTENLKQGKKGEEDDFHEPSKTCPIIPNF